MMNRFDRVTAILIHLQSKKIVRAKDIAERFNISIRTVYRDIQTLEEAGVPIVSEAGIGYSIMEGYRLPPVMFTKAEATAFLTAEKLIEKFTDSSIDTNFKSAMTKLRAILRNSEKELLENIEENIEVFRRKPFMQSSNKSDYLQTIIDSISEKKAININYHSFYKNQINARNIEPIGVFFIDNYWHTIAFCELRNDYRDFRLDRILSINRMEVTFKKKHLSIKDYLKTISTEQNLETIVIKVDNNAIRFINEQKYYYGFVDEKITENHTQMTFLTSYINAFARWYIVFADQAEIISSDSLKNHLKELLQNINIKNF